MKSILIKSIAALTLILTAIPAAHAQLADKQTVTDEVTVDEDVRKERIDTDGVDDSRR